jgi:hypothetical protein
MTSILCWISEFQLSPGGYGGQASTTVTGEAASEAWWMTDWKDDFLKKNS